MTKSSGELNPRARQCSPVQNSLDSTCSANSPACRCSPPRTSADSRYQPPAYPGSEVSASTSVCAQMTQCWYMRAVPASGAARLTLSGNRTAHS